MSLSPSNNLSGNKSNPVVNSAGKEDKFHTRVFKIEDINEQVGLTRGGMILIGLLSGGDYEQGGLARCGSVTAYGLAKCGFGDTLLQATQTLDREGLADFLISWRNELRHELKTNAQGFIGRKQPNLAKSVPEAFPNIDILLSYTNPITSESMGCANNNAKITWSKEPDLGKLASVCEFYFEWGYREAIIKRFRTVIWRAAVQRILRRAVLDKDAQSQIKANDVPVTPRKNKAARKHITVGTPSKLITKHFSSLMLGSPKGNSHSDEEDEDERLIVKIHSSRQHVSTDNVLEYRLEVAPSQLVRIAESGIEGRRSAEGTDEWASEEDGDEEGMGKKAPPDPHSHMRMWMPACMVESVEEEIVAQFKELQEKKRLKKSGGAIGRGKLKNGKPNRPPPVEEVEEYESLDDALPTVSKQNIKKTSAERKRAKLVPLQREESSDSDELPPILRASMSALPTKSVLITREDELSISSGEESPMPVPKVPAASNRSQMACTRRSRNSLPTTIKATATDISAKPAATPIVRDFTKKKLLEAQRSLKNSCVTNRGNSIAPAGQLKASCEQLEPLRKEGTKMPLLGVVLRPLNIGGITWRQPEKLDGVAEESEAHLPRRGTAHTLSRGILSSSSEHAPMKPIHKVPHKGLEKLSPRSKKSARPVSSTSGHTITELPSAPKQDKAATSATVIELSDSDDELPMAFLGSTTPMEMARARAQSRSREAQPPKINGDTKLHHSSKTTVIDLT